MPNTHKYNWLRGLPNQLTLFRIAVIPLLLVLFPWGINSLNIFCAALFAIAALTDFADGFIARQFKMESKLGGLIDPIADKLLTTAGLVLLTGTNLVWSWLAGILLCREIALSGFRLLAQQQGLSIPVNWLGKAKTFFLDVAIPCLIVKKPLFGFPFWEVGMVSIWIALVLSIISAWVYIKGFLQQADL